MKTINYKNELQHLYNSSPKIVAIVDVPEMNFLMIDGQGDPNTSNDKTNWSWTAMIMQPEPVTRDLLAEGKAAQTMHVGPFSAEGPTLERIHDFIRCGGATASGKHHEVYLSNIRKAAPEKWRTILRQPLETA
jgi:hypothetical protein